MPSSIDDLLNSPEDNGGDFEIGDEEEEALLNDTDPDDVVLDLDNTDFGEDENEENIRQDKFQTERPIQKVEVIKDISNADRQPIDYRNKKRNYRSNNNYQRRGYYHNNNSSNKRVLINPHFKGQVPIRNNISLVWDKNSVKKPAIQVQPWAETIRPPSQTNTWISPGGHYQPQSQINTALFVPPRPNILPTPPYVPPANQSLYFHPQTAPIQSHPPLYQSPPYAHSAPLITPPPSHYNGNVPPPFVPQPHANNCYNTPPPPVVTNFAAPPPALPPANGGNNFQRTFTAAREGDGRFVGRRGVSNMGPHGRRRFLQSVESRGGAGRSNLQEIVTSDFVPIEQKKEPIATPPIEPKLEPTEHREQPDDQPEDELLAEYRELIKRQERLREMVLRRKEERRLAEGSGAAAPPPPTELLRAVAVDLATARDAPRAPPAPAKAAPPTSARAASPLGSFLANRKVFAPGSRDDADDALPDTSIVVVSNLATGSTEVKLRKLCRGVGDVKNLVMSPQERQATIQFKSVASAHAFYKRYHRFMLDLSMIKVVLKEQ